MQVADLIEKLKKLPQDAHVVIAGDVVNGVVVVGGSVEIGYYNPVFRKGKGKEQALCFTKNGEISTGEVLDLVI